MKVYLCSLFIIMISSTLFADPNPAQEMAKQYRMQRIRQSNEYYLMIRGLCNSSSERESCLNKLEQEYEKRKASICGEDQLCREQIREDLETLEKKLESR